MITKLRIISFIALTCLLLVLCGFTSAKQFPNIEDAKHALAEKYATNFISMTPEEASERAKIIDKTLLKMAAENKAISEIDQAMSIYKVYRLVVPAVSTSGVTPMDTSPNDAICNSVNIYYDSTTANWIVCGGGWWTNNNWFNDRYWLWIPYRGEIHNCGGYDSIGITYYNTSGTYNTSVISSMGYATDQNGWSEYSYSPSHGNGALGVAFDFQDRHKYISGFKLVIYVSDMTYSMKGYSALVRYNSNFVNYNGYARTFYAHTWNSCNITGITFGTSGSSFGVNVTFTPNDPHGWRIFNNSDTLF